MDIKHVIARMASDCDLRVKFLRQFPNLLDNYLLTKDGEIITREEAKHLDALKFLWDGLNFISSRV